MVMQSLIFIYEVVNPSVWEHHKYTMAISRCRLCGAQKRQIYYLLSSAEKRELRNSRFRMQKKRLTIMYFLNRKLIWFSKHQHQHMRLWTIDLINWQFCHNFYVRRQKCVINTAVIYLANYTSMCQVPNHFAFQIERHSINYDNFHWIPTMSNIYSNIT